MNAIMQKHVDPSESKLSRERRLLLDVGPHRLGDRDAARLAADARDLREGGRLRHRLEEARPLLLHGRRALLASRLGGSSR